jgi:ABC-type lipoprotein release transport system permease subunit
MLSLKEKVDMLVGILGTLIAILIAMVWFWFISEPRIINNNLLTNIVHKK